MKSTVGQRRSDKEANKIHTSRPFQPLQYKITAQSSLHSIFCSTHSLTVHSLTQVRCMLHYLQSPGLMTLFHHAINLIVRALNKGKKGAWDAQSPEDVPE